MIKNIFWIGFLAITNICLAQEGKLYFVVGHPFYDAEPFPSYLLRFNSISSPLDTIHKFSTNKEALREVKFYPEERKIILVKDGGFLTENNHKEVQILDMNIPQKLDTVSLDSINYDYLYSWLLNINNTNNLIFCIQLANANLKKKID